MQIVSTGNAIIDLLLQRSRNGDLQSIMAIAERTYVDSHTELQRSGAPVEFAIFPLSGMGTLVWGLDDGPDVTIMSIGAQDAIHATPEVDLERAVHHVRTCLPSEVLKIPATRWQAFVSGDASARGLLARYGHYVLARTQQELACCAKHDVESRFCRWLVDIDERQNGRPFPITHQTLSGLLGVRRTTITLMARSLQDAGIIAYRRGMVEVTDLHALKQASCRCHNLRHAWQNAMHGDLESPPNALV